MTSFTQNVILDIFSQKLESTSFDKLTVSDIISDGNISRNTFYYYYKDIYALLDTWLETQMKAYDAKSADMYWLDGVKLLFNACKENKRWIDHLLNSEAGSHVERYIYSYTSSSLSRFAVQIAAPNTDPQYIDAVADILRYTILGYFLRFYWDGMTADVNSAVERLGSIFGTIIRKTQAD